MKLVFLCKRRPMGRDLLTDPYGRFFHLPRILAAKGHEVHVLLLSYQRDPPQRLSRDGIHWTSVSVFPAGPARYLRAARRLVRDLRPDWIAGLSDTYYGIFAQRLAARHGARCLIDAYDNYEGYIPWLKPLHWRWRRALARADLVTVAGPGLGELIAGSRTGSPPLIVPMAADPVGFHPRDRRECRTSLGLPPDKKLVGYCGNIAANRGIGLLFEAFAELAQKRDDVELVLSGRKRKGLALPPRVRWLGYLPHKDIPALLNSLDVLVVVNRDSAFGNHSHPVKLCEAMRCEIPVVATATPATRWMLRPHPELLVPPGDARALANGIEQALDRDRVDYGLQPDWESGAGILERALVQHAAR